jgi:Fe-S oxidoreductase/nitrogen-specific signal transduction histidine kinase
VPRRDQSGKIVGILSTAENITRELDLEKQLLQSQKMEAIGTLAGGIAHDFNNILTSIINSTELAIGDVDPKSPTAKDLERVLKAARRGGRVVKQILAFIKPSQEGFRPTNLTTVVTEVVGLMEVSLPGNIAMRSHISPNLGCILADPTQIYQAVMSLCTNAFHALREHGGTLQIRLEEQPLAEEEAKSLNLEAGDYIQLTIIDDGPGIAPSIIDKIFDPFFSTKDKTKGTGLGLAVVHGIVKAHQGGLRVDSQEGQGTSFRLFFPKIGMSDDLPEQKKIMFGRRGGTILFVDKALPTVAEKPFRDRWPELRREVEHSRTKIALFSGCVQDFVYPEQMEAARRLFADRKVGMSFPMAQSCCGLPLQMMGEARTSRDVALQNIRAFEKEDIDHIVTLCASCASHLKHNYPVLLGDDPKLQEKARKFAAKVIDFSSFAHDILGLRAKDFTGDGKRATFHSPCHLCRGLGVQDAPRNLIRAAGLDFIEADESEVCCGFGGTFSAKFPELSAELLNKKLDNVVKTGAEILLTDCPGCIMQLRGGLKKRESTLIVQHTAEALALRLKDNN